MKSKLSKAVAMLLCVMLCISLFPVSAFAEWNNTTYDSATFGTNGYYNVISQKDYDLVPGAATETEMVLNNADGTRRQVLHIIEVDPSNPDVSIVAGYYGVDKYAEDPTNTANWKAAGVTDVADYYEDTLGYNVVGAMNTGLAYDNNAPYSWLVYNGEVLVDAKNGINNEHSGTCSTMLCVYKDEETGGCTVELRTAAQGLRGDEWQAIGANFSMTVNNGELVNKSENHSGGSDDAARSMIGVKEDGTLVLVMNDGRGANNSKGFCSYELGESMLALGCKWAFNCDGGGSSSFVTRRAGESDLVCRATPCDGAERPTLNSVLIVSNVAATGVLDAVNVTADYDYFAPGTTYTFGATAVDTHGYQMTLPENAVWALSDDSFGTIENGTFVSNGKLGEVTVQLKIDGVVYGSKTITVANPETFKFAQDSTTIPYGKSVELEIISLVGEAELYLGNSVEFALDNAGGTVEGNIFTAGTDESIAKTVVTVTYKPTGTVLSYTVNFGKGSEVLWSFEDGELGGFLGQQDAYDWQTENGINAFKNLYSGGNISDCVTEKTFVSSKADGGIVHNGNYAVGLTIDMTQVDFNSWVYANIYNVQGAKVLRDTANGQNATTLGMWVYIPYGFYTEENSGALAIRFDLMAGKDAASAVRTNFNATYNGKTINSLKESDIPENRWIYVTTSLTGYNYVSTEDPTDGSQGYSPDLARMYVKPSVAQTLTYYFDDITLDYSSAVDDRVPPTISDPQYATSDTNISFADGVTITDVSAAFNATIADDNSGIDASTAQIYVDGNKVTTKVTGNTMYCSNVSLGVGTHKVKFEIADKLGNYTTLTRTIVSESTDHQMIYRTRIELSGHNESGETPMPGSVYWIDVSNSYSEGMNNTSFTLELSSANSWILDQIEITDGYNVTYAVDNYNSNKVTFTVSSEKMNGSSTVMFSVPVRVYNPLITNGVSDGSATYVSGKSFKAPLSVEMTACTVGGSYGNYFKYSVAELDSVRTITRHEHTATAVADKAATCTEDGYTGRTYCEECRSVVDFGTTIPATGHNYVLTEGQFVCSECGDVYAAGTGLFEMNGKLYYAINGVLQTGWQTADDGYCYADADTYEVATGEKTIGGVTYTFGENGILSHGEWITNAKGTKYSYGPNCYSRAWVEIDGNEYYFGRDGYMYTGIRFVKDSPDTPSVWYDFGTDGVTDKSVHPADGLYELSGEYYVVKDGQTVTGLAKVGDYYYFGNGSGFDKYGCAAKNATVYITGATSNGLLNSGSYYFGADGKMVVYNGPVNGYFYDETGNMVHAYKLVEFEGNYYYVSDYHKYAVSKTLFMTSELLAGTGLKAGYFTFDETGKMVVKNGAQDDGFFYLKGVKQLAYQLVEYEGNYYFISDYNKYVVNKTMYIEAKFLEGTNFKAGYFTFDETGKMVIKNGPQDDGYLYLDGVKQLAYQLVKYEGNYYYISDYNKYVTNKTLFIEAQYLQGTNLKAGYYYFDENGVMSVKNGPQDNGFFYIDDVKQLAYQLVEWEGDYYFISDYNKYVANKTMYIEAKFLTETNFKAGYFTFDETGKMVIKNGPQDDGYLYLDGVKQLAYQLVECDGNYYFISDYNKYVVNKTMYIEAKFLEGTNFKAGYFTFDETGKMVIKNGPQDDGYLYLDGVKQLAYQLVEYDGNYYFISDYNKYVANKTMYLSANFLKDTDFSAGYFTFDASGRMITSK